MQGVIERAEFWLWWGYHKQDLGLYTFEDMKMYASLYTIHRQDGRTDIQEWLERTKRQIQFCQNPLREQWKRLAEYEEAA